MKRAPLTNVNLHAIVKELAELLENSYIANIYQAGDLLLFKLSSKNFEGKRILLVDFSKRLHLTNFKYPTPKYPSQFCMALRKYLKKKRVNRVYQHGLDRIVVFEINNPEGDPWKFVVEFFGGGNYYLLRPDDTIFVAKKYKILRNRRLLAKQEYKLPEARGLDPTTVTREQLGKLLAAKNSELVRDIARNLNVGGVIAEEICARAGVDKKKTSSELSGDEVDKVHEAITEFFQNLSGNRYSPQVVLDEGGEPVELLPFDFQLFAGLPRKEFSTMNEAADEYYGQEDVEKLIEEEGREKREQLSREQRILNSQEEQIRESQKKIEVNQKIGDLIYEHFAPLEELLRVVNEAKFVQKREWGEIERLLREGAERGIESAQLFTRFIPERKEVTVTLDGIPTTLSLELSVQDNASRFYDRVKKARKKIEGAREAIKRTKKRLKKKQREKETHESQQVGLARDRKKAWYEKFHWFRSSDGFLVVGGRDLQTNELIFKKYIAPKDLVLHTEMRGSPIGVIKNESDEIPPEPTLEEAAQFISCFSKAWKMGWSGVKVFWVHADQVSKTPPSGEYLPKGSFTITGKKNFLSTGSLIHRVGLLMREKKDSLRESMYIELQVISGPPTSIEKQTDIFVDIIPSKKGLGVGQLAKKILATFKQKIPEQLRKWSKVLTLEEIQLHIPGGLGEVRGS
ncbi:MAG: ribosome rescue protein RqcH [Promethearchaeota archaeon]